MVLSIKIEERWIHKEKKQPLQYVQSLIILTSKLNVTVFFAKSLYLDNASQPWWFMIGETININRILSALETNWVAALKTWKLFALFRNLTFIIKIIYVCMLHKLCTQLSIVQYSVLLRVSVQRKRRKNLIETENVAAFVSIILTFGKEYVFHLKWTILIELHLLIFQIK